MTRQDYMANKATHRQYYAQFVTPQVRDWVEKRFGYLQLGRAVKAGEHLNTIPLHLWDKLANCHILSNCEIRAMLAKAGDGMSLATAVCILKEAGRQVVEKG